MVLSQGTQQALGGMALAVVFARPVWLDDGLRHQRKDGLVLGMHQHRAESLMGIGDLPVAVVLFTALRAMNLPGREIPGAIHRQQVMAIPYLKPF